MRPVYALTLWLVRFLLLVALCSCNQVFGLGPTEQIDAAAIPFFDAPPDAPPACPAPGGEPKFNAAYVQVPVQDCASYMPTTEGSAVAFCAPLGIAQGPNDGALASATLSPASDRYRYPRVSADSAVMFVENAATGMLDVFRHQPDDTWSYTRSLFDASYRFISNATLGPKRHAVQTDFNGAEYGLLHLEEQDTGEWTEVDNYRASEIGMAFVDQPSLTSDGLHMTFIGIPTMGNQSAVYYAQRSSRQSRFGVAVKLTTAPLLPGIETPFMTDHCSRFYFSGLRTVFYQKQL